MSFKNADTVNKQVEDIVNRKMAQAVNKEINLEYGDELRDRIVKRTQLSNGINDQGNTVKLKALSEPYKKERKRRSGNLASTTQPSRSNLTATGQLLKSLTVVKLKIEGSVALVFRIGDRRGRDFRGRSSSIGNKAITDIQAKQGRRFFGFTKSQLNIIREEVAQKIKKILKNS